MAKIEGHDRRQNYTIKLMIGDIDYSTNLRRVRITSSAATKYHDITLELEVESETILNKTKFFDSTLRLTIQQISQDLNVGEELDLELFVVSANGLNMKSRDMKSIEDSPFGTSRDKILLGCIPIEAFKAMSKVVAKCFMDDFQKPPIEVVKYILEKFLPNTTTEISEKDINSTPVPRTFNVPQMAFSTFIDWVDGKDISGLATNIYGPLYNGPMVAFYGLDKFYMHSIKHRLQTMEDYIVHLLPASGDNDKVKDILTKSSETDNNFYTRIPVTSKNLSQGDVASAGYKQVIRVKPSDKLFHDFELDISKVYNENTPKTKGTLQDIHETVKEREVYKTTYRGNEYDESWAKSQIARKLFLQSELNIILTRTLAASKLLNVGSILRFEPLALDYEQYSGNYIVLATDLTYTREMSEIYTCSCAIRCFRGNVRQ